MLSAQVSMVGLRPSLRVRRRDCIRQPSEVGPRDPRRLRSPLARVHLASHAAEVEMRRPSHQRVREQPGSCQAMRPRAERDVGRAATAAVRADSSP